MAAFSEAISWAGIGLYGGRGIINLILRNQEPSTPQDNFYTIALALKLFLFVAMVVHHCAVFKYGPKIASLTTDLPAVTDSLAGTLAHSLAEVVPAPQDQRRAWPRRHAPLGVALIKRLKYPPNADPTDKKPAPPL